MFDDVWYPISRGDLRGYGMYERHYSFVDRGPNRLKQFGALGPYLALMTPEQDALFVWVNMDTKYRQDGQEGIYCSIFRNEGKRRSSDLILAAEQCAFDKWGVARLFTFVAPNKIKSVNPGYCFKVAGWRYAGKTSKGLHILEKLRGNNGQVSRLQRWEDHRVG